jgi:hypothetical protein
LIDRSFSVIIFGGHAVAANPLSYSSATTEKYDPMTDRGLGNFSVALRTPDIKFTDVRAELIVLKTGEKFDIQHPDRVVFVFIRSGD